MNKEQIFESWFKKLTEEANATAFISGVVEFDIPETPEGVTSWNAHDGSSELDWSDYWESEVLNDINHSAITIKTPAGEFETVDFEFLTSSLSYHGDSAAYSGLINSWVDVSSKNELARGPYTLIIHSARFGKIETPITNFKVENYDF